MNLDAICRQVALREHAGGPQAVLAYLHSLKLPLDVLLGLAARTQGATRSQIGILVEARFGQADRMLNMDVNSALLARAAIDTAAQR